MPSSTKRRGSPVSPNQRCLQKRGARQLANYSAADFYAQPVVEEGSQRGSQFAVSTEEEQCTALERALQA